MDRNLPGARVVWGLGRAWLGPHEGLRSAVNASDRYELDRFFEDSADRTYNPVQLA